MWFRGKVPFLFWHFALFALAPRPFEILAGALPSDMINASRDMPVKPPDQPGDSHTVYI